MQYTRYTFTVSKQGKGLELETIFDLLSEDLGEVGFDCFEQEGETLLAYIPREQVNQEEIKAQIENFAIPSVAFDYTSEEMPEENWNEEWEKHYFEPLLLSEGRCRIRAPFHTEDKSVKTELIINPKMAFGTGNHETTSLIISYILEHNISGLKVLDMGCGTGILGILALKEGAKSLTAIDIDEWAYENVMENAKLNEVQIDEIIQGDASSLAGKEDFDLVLANITRNILYQDLPEYAKVMKQGARIVLSGFYQEDVAKLRERGESLGLAYASEESQNKWTLLELIKE